MSNKTAIAVDRWVAKRVREFREHDDVGMVFDGVDGVLVRDDGDSDAPQVPMHVSTLTLKVASQEGTHHLVHVLRRELPPQPLLQRLNSNTADRRAQHTRGAQRLEDASRGQGDKRRISPLERECD